MIQRLQKLKSKRGFTVLELVVVLAIIAIMAGTILSSSSNRRDRVKDANSTAKDFFTTIQTEFTRFQMFDGPITMSLQGQYNMDVSSVPTSTKYGGMMWFPRVGGNYPLPKSRVLTSDWRNELPSSGGITLEIHVVNNKILNVDWDWNTADLFARMDDTQTGDARSELSAVLQLELDRRMEYRDGYYYARVAYSAPATTIDGEPGPGDYKAKPVNIAWTAYCTRQLTSDENTYKFRTSNVNFNGQVVGVIGGDMGDGTFAGDPGTSLTEIPDPTT